MTKTKAKSKKVAPARKSTKRSVASGRVRVSRTCDYPTTLFEVRFSTTLIFWLGVALFFLLMVLMAYTIL